MNRTDDLPDDLFVRHAARTAAGDHPGDDDLVAWVERRLADDDAARVEAHLAACAACRGAAETLRVDLAADAVGATSAPSGAWRRWLPGLAAAVLLVGLGWFFFGRGGSGPTSSDPEARLVAAARDLAAADPATLGDFRPLSAEERGAAGPSVERGAARVLAPAGTTDDARPVLRWSLPGAAGAVTVSVVGEDGTPALRSTVEGSTLEWPADAAPLAPGRAYVAKVSGRGADATLTATRAFRVASVEEARRFADAARAIRARAPADLADLLVAHLALRADRLETARRTAEVAMNRQDGGSIAEETYRLVLRRLGEASR